MFHCGGLPLKNRKKPNFRAVFYICMTPRKWSTEESEYIKQMYFSDGLQSIEDLVFQPIINPENKYDWCFIVPKISEKK